MEEKNLVIFTDGGSRGNPGSSACAFSATVNGKVVAQESKFLGIGTNNAAEYEGVILALNWLKRNVKTLNISKVNFILDSELVVKQLNGVYRIKKADLLEKNILIKNIIKDFDVEVVFENVPREENKIADKLLNEELDKQSLSE